LAGLFVIYQFPLTSLFGLESLFKKNKAVISKNEVVTSKNKVVTSIN